MLGLSCLSPFDFRQKPVLKGKRVSELLLSVVHCFYHVNEKVFAIFNLPGYYGDFEYKESRNGDDEARLDKASGSLDGGYMVEAFGEYTHPPIQLGKHVQG